MANPDKFACGTVIEVRGRRACRCQAPLPGAAAVLPRGAAAAAAPGQECCQPGSVPHSLAALPPACPASLPCPPVPTSTLPRRRTWTRRSGRWRRCWCRPARCASATWWRRARRSARCALAPACLPACLPARGAARPPACLLGTCGTCRCPSSRLPLDLALPAHTSASASASAAACLAPPNAGALAGQRPGAADHRGGALHRSAAHRPQPGAGGGRRVPGRGAGLSCVRSPAAGAAGAAGAPRPLLLARRRGAGRWPSARAAPPRSLPLTTPHLPHPHLLSLPPLSPTHTHTHTTLRHTPTPTPPTHTTPTHPHPHPTHCRSTAPSRTQRAPPRSLQPARGCSAWRR
jgi:hypothetical protein